MVDRRGPTVRRRHLAGEMRRLRKKSGKTAAQIVAELGWSEGKLWYIESGQGVRPNPRDVDDLCDVYEVTDERQREYLRRIAREARQRGWWQAYKKEELPPEYFTLIGLEDGAAAVYSAGLGMLPGLIQTGDYARALLIGGPTEMSADARERRVEIRSKRQDILTTETPVRLHAVLDEAVIRRVVGGKDVMRAQLEHLIELADLPNVTLQVVPFGAGAHPALGGPFTILKFPHEPDEPPDTPTVYIEAIAGQFFLEEISQVEAYTLAFEKLTAAASPPTDTIAMIADTARNL